MITFEKSATTWNTWVVLADGKRIGWITEYHDSRATQFQVNGKPYQADSVHAARERVLEIAGSVAA